MSLWESVGGAVCKDNRWHMRRSVCISVFVLPSVGVQFLAVPLGMH